MLRSRTTSDPEPPRRYTLRPSTEAVTPSTAENGFTGLHDALQSADATLSCTLTTGAGEDTPVQYTLTTDESVPLQRTVRSALPNTYELSSGDTDETGLTTATEYTLVGCEIRAVGDRKYDWQTALTPFAAFLDDDGDTHAQNSRVPLTNVVETLTNTPYPVIFDVLVTPRDNWQRSREDRTIRLREGRDTRGQRFFEAWIAPWFGDSDDQQQRQSDHHGYRRTEHDPVSRQYGRRVHPEVQKRIDAIEARDVHHSFDLSIRAVVFVPVDDDTETTACRREAATGVCRDLATAFSAVGTEYVDFEPYIVGDGTDTAGGRTAGTRLLDAIQTHEPHPFRRWYHRFMPRVRRKAYPWVVTDARELGSFLLADGSALTTDARRALGVRDSEQTALPRPPGNVLAKYTGAGMTLGHPVTQDGVVTEEPLILPHELQSRHIVWAGSTGSGKTTAAMTALLTNDKPAGATIYLEPKSGADLNELLRAHYRRHGSLDDVLIFDVAECVPRFSFFDIRRDLAAGIDRETAVEDRIDLYLEILQEIVGEEKFDKAMNAQSIITALLHVCFDTYHGGADAFTHSEFYQVVDQMKRQQSAPSVSIERHQRKLSSATANNHKTFTNIMAGVDTRIDRLAEKGRYLRMFDHVATENAPDFDFEDYLDEDVTIIFDMSRVKTKSSNVITLVIITHLWFAIRRRRERAGSEADLPLVNLYIEEAAKVAASSALTELLSEARGFDLSVALMVQFPEQLREKSKRLHKEVLNNVSTFCLGSVPVEDELAKMLATDQIDRTAMQNRLGMLAGGEWLVSLPNTYGERLPLPFGTVSASPLPGVSFGDDPLTAQEEADFQRLRQAALERTADACGLRPPDHRPVGDTDEQTPTATTHSDDSDDSLPRLDSPLPYTRRLPPTVEYRDEAHALFCRECTSRYDPTTDGLFRAIDCCSSLDRVDPDDIPVTTVNLKLSSDEVHDSEWSPRQLMFLQAVYNAQQLRFDPREYDLTADSMVRLQEYLGVETDDVDPLVEADLLRHDGDHPHRLYSVSPAGRKVIGEHYREGVDYGHGKGDLEESSQHVLAIEVTRRWLDATYVTDPDSPIAEVMPYYDLDAERRLDVAGLDADGEITLAVEIERVNHDLRRAAPDDFDKMADCDVEEAIWVVLTRSDAHAVLQALNDPLDGDVRVEKTYSENTPPQQFRLDTPGCTAIYPVEALRDGRV
jgi:DNA helicase HerA-like ATPase